MYRKKTYRCFFKNVQCFLENVQCFFKNVQCFFQNNGMFKSAIISKAQIFNNETNRYPLQERLKVSWHSSIERLLKHRRVEASNQN